MASLGLGDYFSKITTVIQNSKNALLNLSEIEVKVLNATSNEPWGPSTTEMREIAKATHSYANFPLIMNVIWKRLTEEVQYWRQPYKALTLLDFLVKMGSEQVIREARVHVMEIQSLADFQRIDSEGDQGSGVRDKAKALIELIHDDARIKEEREKARQNAAKFMVSASSERRSDNYRSSDSGYPGFSSDSYESNGRSNDKSYGQNRSGYDSNSRSSYDPKPSSDFNRSDSSRQPASRYDDDDSFTRSGGISPRGNSSAKVSAPAPTPAPAPLPNLIDISEFAPAPPSAPKPTTQPFIPPTQHFIPPTQHNQTSFPAFSSPSAPSQSFVPSFAPSTSNSANNGNDDWADFGFPGMSTSKTQQQQQQPQTDSKDPWARNDLFDLNLSGSSTTQTNPETTKTKTPMSALTGAGRGTVPASTFTMSSTFQYPGTQQPSAYPAQPVGMPTGGIAYVGAPSGTLMYAQPMPANGGVFYGAPGAQQRPNNAPAPNQARPLF
jgi:hypothetical protein